MRLTGCVIAGAHRLVPLGRSCLLAGVAAMAGCVEVGTVTDGGQTAAQRQVHAFRAWDGDYANIVAWRDDVRKHVAGRGWGVVDREGDPLNTYLDAILRRLVAVSPVPDVPARVVVLDLQRSPVAQGTDQITVYFLYTFSETRRATPPRHRTLGVGQTSDVRARLGAPGHASAGEGG